LGLTLASIFPHRIAAGLYLSSFGQSWTQSELDRAEYANKRAMFTQVGTLWVDGDEAYRAGPCLKWTWLTGSTRNTLGYIIQYVLLYAIDMVQT
jgi:hypothetical protein